jgi:3-oxoacyl-[acyl-carrier protein] reductase
LGTGPLCGRTALVTGANHGIGAAVAVELAKLGADVLVTYLRSPSVAAPGPSGSNEYQSQRRQDASEVFALMKPYEARFASLEVDLVEEGSAAAVFDEAETKLGDVSILVNNASGWHQDTFSGNPTDALSRPTKEVSAATFDSNFAVDAKAGALLISEFARRHIRRGATWGRIVGLSSGGWSGFPSEVSYGAAKAALKNLTMSASAELARAGVTANIVYPPITDTGWITDDVRQLADRSGSHVAEPAQVAGVVGWLCTDAAGLVTGNRIRLR